MRLLSRFIWLVIGISAIVAAGIFTLHLRADKEFEKIKISVKDEYNQRVDKMLRPNVDRIGSTASFIEQISGYNSSIRFILNQEPDPEIIKFDIDDDLLPYHHVDALWYLKEDGTVFFQKSVSGISIDEFKVPSTNVQGLFENEDMPVFYRDGDQLLRFIGARIEGQTGFVFAATVQDEEVITAYEEEIDNAEMKFVDSREKIGKSPKEVVRIIRDLHDYNNETVAVLEVKLSLPFLTLWDKTTSADNWLQTISLLLIVFLVVASLVAWVISPLKRISESLKLKTDEPIRPLVQNKTELGEVARMISDYHIKTNELESSESIKRHIIESAHVGIIIVESDSMKVINANPYACDLIGAMEDDIVGNQNTTFFSSIKSDDNQRKDLPKNQSDLLKSFKGIEIPILRTVNRILMDGKQVFLITFVDLSEIKKLQDQLSSEKKKLNLALKNSGLSYCEYDFETDTIELPLEWNFIMKGDKKLIRDNVVANIESSDMQRISGQFESIISGTTDNLNAEFRVEHPERGTIWVSASIFIDKRDEKLKPLRIIGLINDITERISVQQQLIQAKEKAEESDRMKSAYLANMSHKIRTPMNAIVGFSNLLTEEDITQVEKDSYVNIIRNDTESLLVLIDDIINIARIDAQQLSIAKKDCEANVICSNVADYFKAHDKTDHIKFEVKTMLLDGKDVISTDCDKLSQVMHNLLNNAFKFTNKGKIELGYFVNPVEKRIVFYVKDTGSGIPKESFDKIFNRFYQVDMDAEGTGLGLTISKGLVDMMDGKIYFDSKVNEGTTFYIELPMTEE